MGSGTQRGSSSASLQGHPADSESGNQSPGNRRQRAPAAPTALDPQMRGWEPTNILQAARDGREKSEPRVPRAS